MYYLIPALYGQGAEFLQPDLTPWYFRTSKIEFDDTLHQARIFQGQAMSPRLLLLAYQPHLRYFLHRFDLLEVSHFSVFDAIQGIKEQPMLIVTLFLPLSLLLLRNIISVLPK